MHRRRFHPYPYNHELTTQVSQFLDERRAFTMAAIRRVINGSKPRIAKALRQRGWVQVSLRRRGGLGQTLTCWVHQDRILIDEQPVDQLRPMR